jgi:hypothetical protein
MKQGYTHVSFVLDNSGSMGPIKNDTIGSFNSFLEKQKADPGTMTFSLFNFNENAFHTSDIKASRETTTALYEFVDINVIPDLTSATYRCDTSTPLLDAIGYAVDTTGKKIAAMAGPDRPEKVVLVILTDGEENASKKYKKDKIVEMIKHQTDVYKWAVVYLGANQDAIAQAHDYGIARASAADFSTVKMNGTMVALSRSLSSYKAAPAGSDYNFTDEDRKDAV